MRKLKTTAKVSKKYIPSLSEEGLVMMVMRPKNKKLAIKIANLAKITQKWPEFDEMQERCGPYTFEGMLSTSAEIIFDENFGLITTDGPKWVKVGNLKPGDSFITQSEKENEQKRDL
jgi:hypothetical protein